MITMFEFTTSAVDLKAQYKRLAIQYHPDKGGTVDQFQQLQEEYTTCEKLVAENLPWDTGSSICWKINDSCFKQGYRLARDVEFIGREYIGNKSVTTIINADVLDLGQNAINSIEHVRSHLGPNTKMQEKNRWIIPTIPHVMKGHIMHMSIQKDAHILPLSEVMRVYPKPDIRHITWMIGRLMHILCMLDYAKIMHGAISPDSLYVDLNNHNLQLYGGWWFATKFGEPLKALPSRSVTAMPSSMKADKKGNRLLDAELVRKTILELIGVRSATQLIGNSYVPKPITEFLATPFTDSSAFDLYARWEKVRDASFGKREFVNFIYDINDVYKTGV